MPPGWGELLAGLGSAAGYVVAVAVLILIAIALIRGDLVPGYVYRAERKRADDADGRLDAAKAKDEAAAVAAAVARDAARAVVDQVQRLQLAGRSDSADEPD